MLRYQKCSHCRLDFPTTLPECPHCGQPRLFPNVEEARSEQAELYKRYESAIQAADRGGTEATVRRFESMASRSAAVICKSLAFVSELADGTRIFPTFYMMRDSGMFIPQGSKWDALRGAADEFFFGQNKGQIRFAALSCEGVGLKNYGESSMVLGERFIAHRTSLFETNTARFLDRGGIFHPGKSSAVPPGLRAIWEDRGRLATAKLEPRINAATTDADFPALLLLQGATSDDDEYIEAQIFGPLTIQSFSEVTLPKVSRRLPASAIKGLTQKLAKLRIPTKSPP